jgi:hypothetical protein
MKQRTRQLKKVSVESLTLAVEVFNRPNPTARTAGVLLPLQHALEMLFKAVIFEKRGTIREVGEDHSYRFSKCLRILRSDLCLLDESEVLIAEATDAHRDAVQHYGSLIRHEQLYVDAMGTLTVFDDLHDRVFRTRLADLPEFRDLPLALTSHPPKSLHTLVSSDFREIKRLLEPGRRARAEAAELLRPHVLTDRARRHPHEVVQPGERELEQMLKKIKGGATWIRLLPGLARLELSTTPEVSFGLHLISKARAPPDAIPAKLVSSEDPDAADAIAFRERDKFNQFPFNQKTLITQVDGANTDQVRALIYWLRVKDDPKLYIEGKISKMPFAQYSHAAVRVVRDALADGKLPDALAAWRARPTARRHRQAA